MSDTLESYLAAGFALIPIPRGQKGPTCHRGWNRRDRCHVPTGWDQSLGLAHAYSQTCAIDIDDVERARTWLAEQSVDLDAHLNAPDAVRITSGRENHDKLIYRLPTPLCSKKIHINKQAVIDFRCADAGGLTMQDVLPPSLHPDTGRPYEWQLGVAADWRDPPVIPPELLAVWQGQLSPAKPERPVTDAAPADPAKVEVLLAEHDPDCDRATWVRNLAAAHYDTRGSQEGLDIADRWSARGKKYKGRKDVEERWRSFKLGHTNPVTLASLRIDKPVTRDDFPDMPPEPAAEDGGPRIITLRPLGDIIKDQRETEWLLEDILEAFVLAVLAAPRNTLKSFIALHWALLAARAGHGVVLLSGEGRGLDRRAAAWFKTHAPNTDPSQVPFMALERAVNLHDKSVIGALCRELQALPWPLRLVVIDTLSKYSAGLDENDNAEMAAFLSRLAQALRDEFGTSVLLVAHSGHADPRRPRGAYALMANPDAEYIVERPDPNGMLVTVSRERFKDAPSLPPLAYQAEVVDLGRVDKRGKDVTSLALREIAAPARSQREPKGTRQRLVLAAARDAMPFDGGLASVGEVLDRAVAGMTRDPKSDRDTRRQHARQALDSLIDRKFLQVDGDLVVLL